MANEIFENSVRLRAIDKKQAKEEGVIVRGTLDAKEIMRTGRYEIVGTTNATKVTGVPVKADVDPEIPEDPESKAKKVKSMTTAAIAAFVEKEGLKVDLEGLNLKDKREVVITALESTPFGESDDGLPEEDDLSDEDDL